MRENSAERSLYFPPDEKIKTFLTECHINILSMCKLLMENLLLTFELKRQTDIFAAANFIIGCHNRIAYFIHNLLAIVF